MPTSKAAALLIVPSLVTNVWQMFALAGNLLAASRSGAILAPASPLALAMGLGQLLRLRLKPPVSRAFFFAGLFAPGGYLAVRALR